MTAGLPLMKILLTPLAESVLLPVGLSAGVSAADAAIQKKIVMVKNRIFLKNKKLVI